MSAKIYTKTGDKGTTSLIGGTKVPKSHLRIETYGTVDELNSFIGLLRDQLGLAHAASVGRQPANVHQQPTAAPPILSSQPSLETIDTALLEIQDRLFTIGSSLACDPEKETKLSIPDLREEDVMILEKSIDAMDSLLPPMKSFVMPGGHIVVSTTHIVRCVCRRAERSCVRMHEEGLFVEPLVIRYLNRLSDYFFELARYTGHLLQAKEIPWKPRV
jgi:cob(I)alamin adenosyltransferase